MYNFISVMISLSLYLSASINIRAEDKLYINSADFLEELQELVTEHTVTIKELNHELVPEKQQRERFLLLIDEHINEIESEINIEYIIVSYLIDMLKNKQDIRKVTTDHHLNSTLYNNEYYSLEMKINELKSTFMNSASATSYFNYNNICLITFNPHQNNIAIKTLRLK